MSLAARNAADGRPRLRLVHVSETPAKSEPAWQRVASAVLACTHELSRHLLEQRWVRVDEALRERRELLDGMARMPLDADGRRCLTSLRQAAFESEQAVLAMMGTSRLTR